ncbi:MAG: DNA gyrase subunit A [Deltaproteobacteria bacterium]|nr:DNA gyrase subunit A [Deltaproteobacteria bacterium]
MSNENEGPKTSPDETPEPGAVPAAASGGGAGNGSPGVPVAAAAGAGGGDTRGTVQPVIFEEEMQKSYLDYAMSVIVGRAIPDARDGLKPVHRRILYAMHQLNLTPGGKFVKCARVVGDVLGKFHPHGDSSVYDALVRMAQDFSMRMPLVDGQGNFGSVEGDPAAAYRYTECKLTRLAEEILKDIDKETTDYSPNYDGSTEEPDVLPARFPNLLVNGTNGIAVGMATNIPPHNLGEVIDGTLHLIDNPDCDIEALMGFVKGPDFPTGASILGIDGARKAYLTGRGSVTMRAKCEVETYGKGERERIVITEIPYQVNSAKLIEHMAELVHDKKIDGISDLRNESSREGMRIVVELKRDAVAQVVLNRLYKQTQLQDNFGVSALAIVNGQPRVLDLKQLLQVFVDHRRDVITRRTRYELRKAEGEREIVLGLGMATTEIDLVIETIRRSPDSEAAREALMALPLKGLEDFVRRAGRPESEIEEASKVKDFRLSERQAKAILDMRLARLTGLERERLATEYGELSNVIAWLRSILGDESVLLGVIKKELEEVRAKYAEPRRTRIEAAEGEFTMADLVAEEEVVVTLSHQGYVKRTSLSDYRSQNRSGKGSSGMAVRDADWVHQLFVSSSHDTILILTDKGKAFTKKIYEIPEAARAARGRSIVNFLGLSEGERVRVVLPVKEFKEGLDLLTVSRNGLIKRTDLTAYGHIRQTGIIGVSIEDDDMLLTAVVADPEQEIMLGTLKGMSIRFAITDVRQTGRDSRGVKGVELREGDRVVSARVIEDPANQHVLAVCENGFGKRTENSEFRTQHRGGVGIIAIDASDRNGDVVDLALVREDDQLMVVTDKGQILRTFVAQVRLAGRNTQGVKIIDVNDGEKVVAVERVERGVGDEEELVPGVASEGALAAAEGAATSETAPVTESAVPEPTE